MKYLLSQWFCEWLFVIAKAVSVIIGKSVSLHIPVGHPYNVTMLTGENQVNVSVGKNKFPYMRSRALPMIGRPPVFLEDDLWMDLYTIQVHSSVMDYLSWVGKTIKEFENLAVFMKKLPLTGKLVAEISGTISCLQFRRSAVINCLAKRDGYQNTVAPLPNWVCNL